jgi:hypothetical protein
VRKAVVRAPPGIADRADAQSAEVADRAHRGAATRDPIIAAASVWLISNVPLPKAIRAPILRYIADAFMLEFPA